MSDCPTPAQLDAFLAEGEQDATICAHLAQCDACRQRLREIREENAFLREFVRTASASGEGGIAAAGDGLIDDDLVPGYRVLRVLGRGGQAVVYEAEQLSTRRRVALKVLVVGRRRRERRLRRFEREIELVAGLQHPHIVTVYDSGFTRDGQPYCAMEYVEGAPVNEFCRRNGGSDVRARVREVLRLFAGICDAVRHAHQQGIIHRDIKPSNILVDAEGRPRVLDFGLARVVSDSRSVTELTATGEFLGTLIYAAPEQLSGGAQGVDTRTDIYALGVVLYEMLTGVHPYPVDGSVAEVIRNIQQRPAQRPSLHVPAIDDELETIILKTLAKEPDRRYESAAALLDDVRRYLSGEPISAKRDSAWYLLRTAARRYRGVVAAALVFVLVLVAFSVTMAVLYREKRLAEYTARATAVELARTLSLANIERGRLMNLTGNIVLAEKLLWRELLAGDPERPARDASGRWRLPTSPAWWGLWEVYHDNPCRATVRAHDGLVLALAFEPDGAHVVSVGADGAVVRWTPARSRVDTLATLPARGRGLLAALTPDAAALVWKYQRRVELRRLKPADEPAALPLDVPDGQVTRVAIAAGGRRLAVATDAGSVLIADAPAGRWTHSLHAGGTVEALAFDPDGRTLWLLVAGPDGRRLERVSAASGERGPTIAVRSAAERLLRISPDRRWFAWQAGRKVGLMELDTPGRIRHLVGHLDLLAGLAFGPDATAIASGSHDRTVRIWSVSRGEPVRVLYGHAATAGRVAFSPDGARVVSSDSSGVLKLWDVNDPTRRRIETGFAVHAIAWGSRGSIVLTGADDTARRGVIQFCDATSWRASGPRISRHDVIPSVTWIPPTDRLATCSTAGTVRIWAPGGREIAARGDLPPLAHIAASPDGRRLVASENRPPGRLWVLDAATLEPQATLEAHRSRTPSVAFSPDGRQFASASMDGTVVLWDASTLKPQATLAEHHGGVRVVRFSPDGRLLASGCDDWCVRIFDAGTGRLLSTLTGHRQHVFALAFSPDGRLLASGDRGGIVRLWDVATGRNLLRLDENLPGHVMDLTFDPTGQHLAAATTSGVLIWNLTACEPHIRGNRAYWARARTAPPQPE